MDSPAGGRVASVSVEFLGIVKRYAGVGHVELTADTLAELIVACLARFPELNRIADETGRLRRGYVASIDGLNFTRKPETPLHDHATVLILSADVGG